MRYYKHTPGPVDLFNSVCVFAHVFSRELDAGGVMLRDLCRGQLGHNSWSPCATVNTANALFQRWESHQSNLQYITIIIACNIYFRDSQTSRWYTQDSHSVPWNSHNTNEWVRKQGLDTGEFTCGPRWWRNQLPREGRRLWTCASAVAPVHRRCFGWIRGAAYCWRRETFCAPVLERTTAVTVKSVCSLHSCCLSIKSRERHRKYSSLTDSSKVSCSQTDLYAKDHDYGEIIIKIKKCAALNTEKLSWEVMM